jgi:serine phosphatase RsbU (regulator of sigma subunit)
VVLQWFGVFSTTDLRLLDLRFRIRGEREASDAIALIEVDDETIRKYGQWPLSRDVYALLLAALGDAGVRAVGVDLVFVDPDTDNRSSDLLLAAVTDRSRNVCHAVSFLSEPASQSSRRSSALSLELLSAHSVDAAGVAVASAGSALLPYGELLEATHALGHIAVAVDRDGGVRRLPLLVHYQREVYPSLGLALASLAQGDGALPTIRPGASGIVLEWSDGRMLEVPVDDEGATAIDFAGDRRAFHNSYSLLAVLGWVSEGRGDLLQRAFSGQIVLVGSTAMAEAATDAGATPFSIATPLVYVHANAVDAILSGRFLRSPSSGVFFATLAALSGLLGWLFVSLRFRAAVAAMGIVLAAIAGTVYALFVLWRIDVPPSMPLLLPVVVYIAVETYRSVFMERRAQEREKELGIARQVQEKLFPAELPTAEGWEFAGVCHPAREVGGDYYDLMELDRDRVAVALGDVSGKGLGPSILMSNVHAMIRSCLRRPGTDPVDIVVELNDHLCSSTSPGMFITLFIGVLDLRTGEFRYVNGGHNPGLLVGAGQTGPVSLETGGMIVGAMPGASFKQGCITLDPGITLALFSDGVTEAFDDKDEMFGDERLIDVLLSSSGLGAVGALDRVVDAVARFRGRREASDDLSVVVVYRQAEAPQSDCRLSNIGGMVR